VKGPQHRNGAFDSTRGMMSAVAVASAGQVPPRSQAERPL
jgi:hypothetical protein